MSAIDTAIKWFTNRQGKVTYSMTSRNGPSSYDCSSSVYHALIAAGLLPKNTYIGNTDSEFGDLEKNGWTKVPLDKNGNANVKRGDVFIWGKRGASAGSFGHTGMFVNTTDIIHCSYGYNGIHVDNHDWLWEINGEPTYTFYRYTGKPKQSSSSATDQIVEVGSYVKFPKQYKADDVQKIGGVWQIRTNELCKKGFTWSDNGIPASPVVEVDSSGYATKDQELDIGSKYVVPGKWKVLDVGLTDGMWLAQLSWSGLKFWVDLATLTEIKSSDAGTPKPKAKPATTTKPKEPTTPPKDTTKPTTPVDEPKDSGDKNDEPSPPPKKDDDSDKTTSEKEDSPVAFTQEDQEKLKIATENAQEFATSVADSETAEELVSSVSKKTKLFVYIIGDSLIGLAVIVPQIAVVAGYTDVVRIVAASGLLSAAGGFLLTMFGIYKSGNKS